MDYTIGATNRVYQLKVSQSPLNVPARWRPIFVSVLYFTGDYDASTWTSTIFRVESDGSSMTPVPLPFNRPNAPQLSPDGQWLYFQADTGGGAWQIFRCKPDGSELANLTGGNGLGTQAYGIAFSPPGDRVAFISFDGIARVAIMNADGSAPYLVAPTIGYHYMASFSADGRRLVFSHTADNYIMKSINLDTSAITTLTPGLGQSYMGQHAPDDSTIVFFRIDGDVYRVPPLGGTVARLTTGAGGQIWSFGPGDTHESSDPPKISPDGTQIAYTAKINGIDQIHVMNLDGTDQRQLTSLPGRCGRAHWSPDSQTLVFASFIDDKAELFTIGCAPGATPTQLTQLNGGTVGYVSWGFPLGGL